LFGFFAPRVDEERLISAIREAELRCSGEIRVHLVRHCKKEPAEAAALVFEALGMRETANRNGVLIFVASNSRRFAIIGDTAIHEKVGQTFWLEVHDAMKVQFAAGDLTGGIEAGIRMAATQLENHFPRMDDDVNELDDSISYG
jgi:uncharacterized membrane protein